MKQKFIFVRYIYYILINFLVWTLKLFFFLDCQWKYEKTPSKVGYFSLIEKKIVLRKTTRSGQTVENPHSFFNVSYTWCKSLVLVIYSWKSHIIWNWWRILRNRRSRKIRMLLKLFDPIVTSVLNRNYTSCFNPTSLYIHISVFLFYSTRTVFQTVHTDLECSILSIK